MTKYEEGYSMGKAVAEQELMTKLRESEEELITKLRELITQIQTRPAYECLDMLVGKEND